MKRILCLIIALYVISFSSGSVSNDIKNDLQEEKGFYLRNVHMNHFMDALRFLKKKFAPTESGGPFLFTNTGFKYEYENNILNKSEFAENKDRDIDDRLLITKNPHINPTDHLITFEITESRYKDYFDKISLIAVDHQKDYSIGITNYNETVMYKSNFIISPKFAELSGEEVTSELAYDSSFEKTVKTNEKSFLNIEYDASNNNNDGDSSALIFDPSYGTLYPFSAKVIGGYINATDEDGNTSAADIEFAGRQKWSVVIVPLFAKKTISKVNVILKHELSLSFAGTVKLHCKGFIEYDLPLAAAENSISGDITKYLLKEDKSYAEIDSASFITLKFKNLTNEIPVGWVRDFVISVNGHYINPGREPHDTRLNNLFEVNPKIINRSYLNQNFPNPFNLVTGISYSLIENSFVSLRVYNILGDEVATLVNETQNAGMHNIKFDGTNFPAGMYYYKMKSGNFVQIRKMILIK